MTGPTNGGHAALRPAWGLSDPKIVQDAKAVWHRLGMLGPAEMERRVSELCAAAYAGDELIGVSTAYPERLETLQTRFVFFRCLVVPTEQRTEVAQSLAILSNDLLEQWSNNNPGEQVMGMAAIIPGNAYQEMRREPVWTAGGLNLNLVGYSRGGEQIRVSWFRHARVA